MPILNASFPPSSIVIPTRRSPRYLLILLAAVFVLPWVIGSGLFWSGWRPGKLGNHGELLQPPRLLPETGLLHADGRLLLTSELRGTWLLVLPVAESCATACQLLLQQMQQVHTALNKERNRLRRVLIDIRGIDSAEENSSLLEIQQQFPELVVTAVRDESERIAWVSALESSEQAIFVVDPLGNIMMRYTDLGNMRGLHKDLEQLLKYSWIR